MQARADAVELLATNHIREGDMLRYLYGAMAACGFLLWISTGSAVAGCCTEAAGTAGQPGCATHEYSRQCTSGVTLESVGTVKTMDAAKGEMVISSGEAAEDVTIMADKTLTGILKEGDTIQVNYETRCINVATGMQKKRPGFKRPGPCTDKKL